MPVSIGDITEAFEFANTGGDMGEFLAFVCKRTGKIHYQTDFPDAAELYDELPDDIDDEENTSRSRTNASSGWASRWCSILRASFCPTISTTSAISSAGEVPTRNSRTCSPDEVRSIPGTPSKRKPRRRRCATGAQCIRSKSSADLARHSE
jgi:hypothetical protein